MIDLSFLQDKNILIVGGTGYIGSSLVSAIKPHTKTLTTWDRSVDLKNPQVWKDQMPKTDLIFYLAAQTSSKFANQHPVEDATVNVLPIATLLEVCTQENLHPDIIFASTVTAVGLTQTFPTSEALPDRPITIYDIHKLTAEKYLYYYHAILKGQAAVLRLANVYGPSQMQSKAADRGVVNFFVKKALDGNPLTVYSEGEFVRDYIYIDDVVNAFILAAKHASKLVGDYYLIGSGKQHTIKQMAETIVDQVQQQTGKLGSVQSVPAPTDLSPIESRHFVADSSRFSTITGWQAETSLEEGIAKTVEYFLKLT